VNAIGKHGVHPTLLQPNCQPTGNAFFAPRRAVVGDRTDAGAPRGGARCNHVPRLVDGSVAVQGTLLAAINGVRAGNTTTVFQSTRVTANVQKASVQNQ